MRIGFIGAGRVATVLALGLARAGHRVTAVSSRRVASARMLAGRIPGCRAADTSQEVVEETDLVFLAVPDDHIAPLAAQLSWRAGGAAVHCSGALDLTPLAPAQAAGVAVGALHPLQAIAQGDDPAVLRGVTFAVDSSSWLADTLQAMARDLGGTPLLLPDGARALYHASASLASNHLVTLLDAAAELWRPFGGSREQAVAALLPLLRGTVDNLERLGLPHALTGPIARGDVGTVRMHLEALEDRAPDLLPMYRQLGLRTIPVALERGGLDAGRAEELRRCLETEEARCG